MQFLGNALRCSTIDVEDRDHVVASAELMTGRLAHPRRAAGDHCHPSDIAHS
jgi:hypothetical protein